jgi:hypothetical protein
VRSEEGFEARRVTVAPGGARAYDAAEWSGAIVVVAHGQIELEATGGSRRTFERGAVLWLVGLPLRALHNHGPERAVMVAFTRRR